jgi:hypothetical protein
VKYCAAIMNAVCPPTPVQMREPIDSAATWPVKSTISALFTATRLSCCTSMRMSSV